MGLWFLFGILDSGKVSYYFLFFNFYGINDRNIDLFRGDGDIFIIKIRI